jgi:hypothetical protein
VIVQVQTRRHVWPAWVHSQHLGYFFTSEHPWVLDGRSLTHWRFGAHVTCREFAWPPDCEWPSICLLLDTLSIDDEQEVS